MEVNLLTNEPKIFKCILNKKLVQVQVQFLKIKFMLSSHNINALKGLHSFPLLYFTIVNYVQNMWVFFDK